MSLIFLAGFACGGFSFIDTQARPLLTAQACQSRCLNAPQVLGLLTSAGIHVAPDLMPDLIAQSDQCVAIKSPKPEAATDFVFFPKRDIRNLLEAGPEDVPYLLDCFALMRQVIAERKVKNWRVVSNGPGEQLIAYLHFHLLAD